MSDKLYVSVSPLLVPVDKEYDYEVPAEYRGAVRSGTLVIVPFRDRKIFGLALKLKKSPQVENPKPITGVVGDFRTVPNDLMRLCHWVSQVFLCPFPQVLETVFPFRRRLKREGIDEKSYIELKHKTMMYRNVSLTDKTLSECADGDCAVFGRAKAKARAVKALFDNGGSMSYSDLMKAANVNSPIIKSLENAGWAAVDYLPKSLFPEGIHQAMQAPHCLLTGQQVAFDTVLPWIDRGEHRVFLLHGVTGSGKTEIYMHLAEETIARGKRVLILVPEIAMGTQIIARFLRRFSGRLAIWHSALSFTERFYEWEQISSGRVGLLVGARSALFAPLEDIGLIIVDEEHEPAYKQESAPRYHGRHTAIRRGFYCSCPVVLGSATPSVETFHQTRTGKYELIDLPERITDAELPEVRVVDMRQQPKKLATSTFSPIMLHELKKNVEAGEQSLVFLNHRGYSQYMQCLRCGHTMKCEGCSVALKYHKGEGTLKCHHCGWTTQPPERCPACSSSGIRKIGVGTEKVMNQLDRFFRDARVARMDRDTTARKGETGRLIQSFEKKEIDILVGTQMIAKGFDFPGVTFVGVISADSITSLPDFRASERTFQLLTQVSGRAGRAAAPGRVLVQTYNPEHPAVKAAREHDYNTFFEYEIEQRRLAAYPPFVAFANFIVTGKDHADTRDVATDFAAAMRKIARDYDPKHYINVVGPAEAPLFKLSNNYRWFAALRTSSLKLLLEIAAKSMNEIPAKKRRMIHPDVYPESMM